MISLRTKFEKKLIDSKKLTKWELPGATKYIKDNIKERDLKLITDSLNEAISDRCPTWLESMGLDFPILPTGIGNSFNGRHYPDYFDEAPGWSRQSHIHRQLFGVDVSPWISPRVLWMDVT